MADLIDRQAAIEAVRSYMADSEIEDSDWHANGIAYEIKRLPTAEPKTGHWIKISPAWIYECSQCGQNVMTGDIEVYAYCHHCGAIMEGEDNGVNQ